VLSAKEQTKIFAKLSMGNLPHGKEITTQVANALHFARGIQNMHVFDTEWHIGIPSDDEDKPQFDFVREVWWVTMDTVRKQQHEGNWSVCILEMRLVKGSQMILSTLRETDQYKWFITIEVLGINSPSNQIDFVDACKEISNLYASKCWEFGFHWPKMWNDVTKNGTTTAAVEYMKQFTHRQGRFDEFKDVYKKIVVEENNSPPLKAYKMFSNSTFDQIFNKLWD